MPDTKPKPALPLDKLYRQDDLADDLLQPWLRRQPARPDSPPAEPLPPPK